MDIHPPLLSRKPGGKVVHCVASLIEVWEKMFDFFAFLFSRYFCQSRQWSLLISIFQDILLGSVIRNLLSTIGPLAVIEARALSVFEIVRQARLILLALTTRFDLQDLSHGKSGLTSLFPCPVPTSSRRIPGHPVGSKEAVFVFCSRLSFSLSSSV
jgi:hypothetical protein